MRSVTALIALLLSISWPCDAAPGNREPTPRGSAPSTLDAMRYTLRSQQSDLKMAQERLADYEEQIDLLRSDLTSVLAERQQEASRVEQRLGFRLQESENRIQDLSNENETQRQDLNLLVDHLKELHTLVESLQSNLQQQTKKNQILEKTLSTLIQTLSPSTTIALADGVEHKVQPGETLEKIARKYGTSIRQLKEQNQLETDRIRVGQKLKLPQAPTHP